MCSEYTVCTLLNKITSMNNFLVQVQQFIVQNDLVKYISAFLVLLLWWIAAKIIASIFRKVMKKATFMQRFFDIAWVKVSPNRVVDIVSLILYYFILFVVLIAFLDILELKSITAWLQTIQWEYLPGILASAFSLILAWVIATIVRIAIKKWFHTTQLDEKISREVSDTNDAQSIEVGTTLANAAYWFVFLFFLPSIIEPLGFGELLTPINDVINSIVGYFPNILAAAIIFIIWMFIAKILKKIVSNLLASVWADSYGKKFWMKWTSVSKLAGTWVYAIVLLPVIVQALDALKIDAISAPAKNMINQIISAIPNLVFAWVIIGISYVVWKLVSEIVTDLLKSLGFNKIFQKIGLKVETDAKPSKVVGWLVLAFIMLFAFIEAANQLGFEALWVIASSLLVFSANILVWIVVIWLGSYIANKVALVVKASSNSKLLPKLAKVAILVLSIAMWLKQMGIADDIINLAFGLTLWAVAVAAALAFGLGSRDIAAKHLEEWIKKAK